MGVLGSGAMGKGRSFLGSERGAVAVMFGLAMPALIGLAAFGSEVGYWQLKSRALQSAADAAAYSGASQIAQGSDAATAQSAAVGAASASGYVVATGNTAAVSTPPLSGAFAGDTDAVEVRLRMTLPRLFTALFLDDDVTISARSVGKAAGARPSCVLALSPSASPAIKFSGTSDVTLDGCDIAANSIAANAVAFGSGDVETPCISTVGGYSGSTGKVSLTDCGAIFTNARVARDPFASRTLPSAGTCDADVADVFDDGGTTTGLMTAGDTVTVCGNVSISNDVDLEPGVYVFVDSRIHISGGVTSGDGVTFVLLGSSYFDWNGNGDLDISAPTDPSDPLRGLLIYGESGQDRAQTINGGAATSLEGAIYLPGDDVKMAGGAATSTPECTLLMADTIEFTGKSNFQSNCAAYGISAPETAQVVLIVE